MTEEDEKIICTKCNKDITENDEDNDTGQYECSECDDTFCDDCTIHFENVDVQFCKDCIDKEYPRESKVVEKIVEKFVEIPKEKIVVMGFSEPIL